MKSITVISILVFISTTALHAQTTYEIFPLKKNLHYSYDYYYIRKNVETISWPAGIDSGTVDYVVNDSLKLNDTTISWNVSEIRNVHRWTLIPDETTYTIRDTASLSLLEDTRGLHALMIISLVWRFPYSDSSHTVYRFDRDRRKVVARLWESGIFPFATTQLDTIKLTDSAGVYYSVSYYQSGTPRNGTSTATTVTLRSVPVAAVEGNAQMPAAIELKQNYPNPFNPSTTISFSLPSRAHVSLKIFDVMGRDVATIVSEDLSAGSYTRVWNASGVSNGVYFYRLQAGTFMETKKLLLVR